MMHTLYVVGTPIGNLEDISPRALETLRSVGTIATENPARTRRLLDRYAIRTPMIRYTDAYDRKKAIRTRAVFSALAAGDVALVSEAGMPVIADPGYELVQAALTRGVRIEVVPGPTALSAALDVAGLHAEPFAFLGFVPRRSAARREAMRAYAGEGRALVLYEAPGRVLDTLRDARAVLGERWVVVACELTKMYEGVWRGPIRDAIARLQETPPRGEYVLVIGGVEECARGTTADA